MEIGNHEYQNLYKKQKSDVTKDNVYTCIISSKE